MTKRFLAFLADLNGLELGWVALWLATVSFTQRTATESLGAQIDATHLQRLAFVGLAALCLATSIGRVRVARFEPLTLFLLYGVVALASAAWSTSVVVTLGKATELMLAILIVWQTVTLADAPRRLLRLLDLTLIVHGALLAVALAGFLVAPDSYHEASTGFFTRQLAAPFMSSNAVAVHGATIVLVSLARFLMLPAGDARRTAYVMLAAGFTLFPLLAQGRTGLAILAVGASLLMLRRRLSLATVVVFPAFAILGVLLLTEISSFVLRGQNPYQVESLSGRTVLWDLAWETARAKPLLGFGFGVGSREAFARSDLVGFGATISSIHNGALEVILGVGFVGFAVWLSAVLWGLWLAFRTWLGGTELDMAILGVVWLARTVMSGGLGGWLDPTIGTFLVAVAYLALMYRSRAPARAVARLARP